MPFLPTPTDTTLNLLYQTISELPLFRFREIVVKGNLAPLIISGSHTALELLYTWNTIQAEFSDAIGDEESTFYSNLLRELTVLGVKMNEVTYRVKALCAVYNQSWVDYLNDMLDCNFDMKDCSDEDYKKNLRNYLNRAKVFKIDYDLKTMEMEAIKQANDQNGEHREYSNEYFLEVLMKLSNYAKYNIADTITVFEFCIRLKEYNFYCKQMLEAAEKRKGNG